MAFLNFVKEHSGQQPSQTPTVDELPATLKSQAVDAARPAAKLMDRATGHAPETPAIQSGQGDGRESLIRNQGDQGKEQAAMSPTDHSKSQPQSQLRTMSRGRGMER